jgi:hypothetical protein
MNAIAKLFSKLPLKFIFLILLFPGVTTIINQPAESKTAHPAVPILVWPQTGSKDMVLTPALDWQDVKGAIGYDVQVATDNKFTNIVSEGIGLTSSRYPVPDGHLWNGSLYYWRVTAMDSVSAGSWSEIWSFTTEENPLSPVSNHPVRHR